MVKARFVFKVYNSKNTNLLGVYVSYNIKDSSGRIVWSGSQNININAGQTVTVADVTLDLPSGTYEMYIYEGWNRTYNTRTVTI